MDNLKLIYRPITHSRQANPAATPTHHLNPEEKTFYEMSVDEMTLPSFCINEENINSCSFYHFAQCFKPFLYLITLQRESSKKLITKTLQKKFFHDKTSKLKG